MTNTDLIKEFIICKNVFYANIMTKSLKNVRIRHICLI